MSMREKMARTMYGFMRARIPNGSDPIHSWENQSQQLHDDWLEAVDAALGVQIDPTDGVVECGVSECVERVSDHLTRDIVWFQFRAMIQAIKDGK